MNEQDRQEQIRVFEKAKDSISDTLDQKTLELDFPGMIGRLKATIESIRSPAQTYPIRSFSRRYLGLSGVKHRTLVRRWINLQLEMSEKDIVLVLGVLSQIQTGEIKLYSNARKAREADKDLSKVYPRTPLDRDMINLIITIVNSLVEMMKKMPVKQSNVVDGDRMRIRTAIKFVCEQLGIQAKFPEGKTHTQPLTTEDLAESGLTTFRKKGKK